MTRKTGNSFIAKHGQDSKVDIPAAVRERLEKAAPAGTLSCAAAFQLSADLEKPPAEIGKAADLLDIRLVKCQLGLFGYAPERRSSSRRRRSIPPWKAPFVPRFRGTG